MLSVPSVEPEKYRSVGYGSTPCNGWNSAVVAGFAGGGVAPPGLPLPLAVLVGPIAGPLPPPQPAASSAVTTSEDAPIRLFITCSSSTERFRVSRAPGRSLRGAGFVCENFILGGRLRLA